VRTLVISDLHLGKAGGVDLLRRPDLRAPLIEALEGVDRLVILGDGLELREAAHREAAEIAAPLFAQAGCALGPDGELLVLAGNHDHGLAAGWIDGRLATEPAGFLGLEQRYSPAQAGPLAQRLAEAARPARTELAYPGVWLRDDVYALHGHYADLHTTVPTFERLFAGAMARFVVDLPAEGATPDDYEAVVSPLYAWMHALTQRADHASISAGAGASARTWSALTASDRHRRPLRTIALGTGFVAAVTALNAAGLGPLERGLSPAALRRGYLRGIREVLRRLGVRGARHVLWGHSHRSGPWPVDDLAEWTSADGARILNTGSWVYQPHFLTPEPNGSPYWPGTAVVIEDEQPPRLVRLLGDRGHEILRPPC
jgi:calcineurin-like phosphoesterase family protein